MGSSEQYARQLGGDGALPLGFRSVIIRPRVPIATDLARGLGRL
jgi:hypothetical protein